MLKGLHPLVISGKEVLPVVEGGKGISVSNGESSGAWAAAGGVGTFSGVNADYTDDKGNIVVAARGKNKGKPEADSALRDTENVSLHEDVNEYFRREVLPHAPDAWIDHDKTKVGYEIPFNRHFYVFQPPRPLETIDAELKQTTDRILKMIAELSA